VELSEDFA